MQIMYIAFPELSSASSSQIRPVPSGFGRPNKLRLVGGWSRVPMFSGVLNLDVEQNSLTPGYCVLEDVPNRQLVERKGRRDDARLKPTLSAFLPQARLVSCTIKVLSSAGRSKTHLLPGETLGWSEKLYICTRRWCSRIAYIFQSVPRRCCRVCLHRLKQKFVRMWLNCRCRVLFFLSMSSDWELC